MNRALSEISARTGIPLAATNDVHYIKKEDSQIQRVLMAIATGSTLRDAPDKTPDAALSYSLDGSDVYKRQKLLSPERESPDIYERCGHTWEENRHMCPS